jgi:hypothetical protein
MHPETRTTEARLTRLETTQRETLLLLRVLVVLVLSNGLGHVLEAVHPLS